MAEERTGVPAAVAGPSAEGTLMALGREFEHVLGKFPEMCEEGDRAEWEKLSKNLDSSCTVERRVDALAFVVDHCRNMFSSPTSEISPDLEESARDVFIQQQLTQKEPLLQHVNDLLLHVFTADQTGFGVVQRWCFKYHWDCLVIMQVVTQLVSDLLGKSNAETDITATATATAAALNLAVGCLVRFWQLVRCQSGTPFIVVFFLETGKLKQGIRSAADKLAIIFVVLKFRRMMVKFVCDHSYSILKGMADSAALTFEKKTFLALQAGCNQGIPIVCKTVKDKMASQGLNDMSMCVNRWKAGCSMDQEPTDELLKNLLEGIEPNLKEFAPGVLRPYGESVVTCFHKMWDSDIEVCKGLHSGALSENAAELRLVRAAPFLCAIAGLGSVLTLGEQDEQGPTFFKQLAKQLNKWSQPWKDTVGQKGQGEERQGASTAKPETGSHGKDGAIPRSFTTVEQKDLFLELASVSSGKRGGQACLLTTESQGKGGDEGLLRPHSSLQSTGDGSGKKTESVVEAHASERGVVPVNGPRAEFRGTVPGARGPSAQARASTANLSLAQAAAATTEDIARRCVERGDGDSAVNLTRHLNLPGLRTCGLVLSRGNWNALFMRFTTDLPALLDALEQHHYPAGDQYSASLRDVRYHADLAEVLAVGVSTLGSFRAKPSHLQSLGRTILKFVIAAGHLLEILLESA